MTATRICNSQVKIQAHAKSQEGPGPGTFGSNTPAKYTGFRVLENCRVYSW